MHMPLFFCAFSSQNEQIYHFLQKKFARMGKKLYLCGLNYKKVRAYALCVRD